MNEYNMNNHIANSVLEDSIMEALFHLRELMEKELDMKNTDIRKQYQAIDALLQEREYLKKELDKSRNELRNAQQLTEGNKQLINKLIGDIARLNQDVQWYKRTYIDRSFWGRFKDKMK